MPIDTTAARRALRPVIDLFTIYALDHRTKGVGTALYNAAALFSNVLMFLSALFTVWLLVAVVPWSSLYGKGPMAFVAWGLACAPGAGAWWLAISPYCFPAAPLSPR